MWGVAAASRNPDADTKPFAEKMVKDHQQTSMELKGLVDGGKVIVCSVSARSCVSGMVSRQSSNACVTAWQLENYHFHCSLAA
jgi:predicted outer membrane protein